LVRPFVPFSENDERKNLIALMAVSSDPGTYGQLRVLDVQSNEQVDGPALVDSEIKRKYAADFTLESQTGSKVRLGTLQAIPIGDSVLWVRPWYVQAEQTPIPQLNYVVVSYGDQVFRARTLEGALTLAFPESQVDFSTTVGPLTPLGPAAGAGEDDGEAAPPATDNSSEQPPGTGGPESVGQLLAQANTLYAEAQTALEDLPDQDQRGVRARRAGRAAFGRDRRDGGHRSRHVPGHDGKYVESRRPRRRALGQLERRDLLTSSASEARSCRKAISCRARSLAIRI
jgi:hypothetical protein